MSGRKPQNPTIRNSTAEFLIGAWQAGEGDFASDELQEDSVIRKFRITAADGKNYDTDCHLREHLRIVIGKKCV